MERLKLAGVLFSIIFFMGLSTFGKGLVLEADWYQQTYRIKPAIGFEETASFLGWFYAGYETEPNWEFGLSYHEWEFEKIYISNHSYKIKLYPTVIYAQYKYHSSKMKGWEPIVGLGYGSSNVVFMDITKYPGGQITYMDSHRYDVFAWTIGVRYFFDEHWGATLRYVRHEIDIKNGLMLGEGYNFGAVYKF